MRNSIGRSRKIPDASQPMLDGSRNRCAERAQVALRCFAAHFAEDNENAARNNDRAAGDYPAIRHLSPEHIARYGPSDESRVFEWRQYDRRCASIAANHTDPGNRGTDACGNEE